MASKKTHKRKVKNKHPANRPNQVSPPVSHKTFIIILVIFASLYLVMQTQATKQQPLTYDDAIYLSISEKIVSTGLPIRPAGKGVIFNDHPPLVPYLLALPVALFGKSQLPIRTVSFIMFWLPLIIVSTLLLRRFGKGQSWLYCLLLYGSFTPFIFMWPDGSPTKLDMPLTMFFFTNATILYLCWRSLNKGTPPTQGPATLKRFTKTQQIALGVLLVCAILSKFTALLLPVLWGLYLIWKAIAQKQNMFFYVKTFIYNYRYLILTALVLLVVWSIVMVFMRANYWSRHVAQFTRFFVSASEYSSQKDTLLYFLKEVYTAIGLPMLLLWAGAIIHICVRHKEYNEFESFFIFIGITFLATFSLVHQKRINYIYPAFPFFILISAQFLGNITKRVNTLFLFAGLTAGVLFGVLFHIKASSATFYLGFISIVLVCCYSISLIFSHKFQPLLYKTSVILLTIFFFSQVSPTMQKIVAGKDKLTKHPIYQQAQILKQIFPKENQIMLVRHLQLAYLTDMHSYPIHYTRYKKFKRLIDKKQRLDVPKVDIIILGRIPFHPSISKEQRKELLHIMQQNYARVPECKQYGMVCLKRTHITS